MASSLQTVISGLGAVAGMGGAASVASMHARSDRRHLPGVHAMRDDTAINPLARPMSAGCASMEVAIWLDGSERLQVGANGWDRDPGNTIDRMVFGPLAGRAARLGGRVYRRQRSPMLLMIEIVEADPVRQLRAYNLLDTVLRGYPQLLTYACDGTVIRRGVTVVLTGAGVPRHRLAAQPDRYAFADGNFGDVGAWGAPATLVPVVSEHWAWRFGWDGIEEMAVEERQLLREIVATAHADGRQVRFFGVPERRGRVREAYWRELFAGGVDLVSTADPRALARFLRGTAVRRGVSVPRQGSDSVAGDGVLTVAGAR